MTDTVAGNPLVNLELGLAWAPGADATAQPREFDTLATHAGQVEFELRQLHLQLSFSGVGMLGEDVEDERGAIDDPHAELVLEVTLLGGRKLVLDNHQVGLQAGDFLLELNQLALAEVGMGYGMVPTLNHFTSIFGAGGGQQLAQLGQRLIPLLIRRGTAHYGYEISAFTHKLSFIRSSASIIRSSGAVRDILTKPSPPGP